MEKYGQNDLFINCTCPWCIYSQFSMQNTDFHDPSSSADSAACILVDSLENLKRTRIIKAHSTELQDHVSLRLLNVAITQTCIIFHNISSIGKLTTLEERACFLLVFHSVFALPHPGCLICAFPVCPLG